MIKRGIDRWYELMGIKWGSRYLVLWYSAWKSSTANKTGWLSKQNTESLDPDSEGQAQENITVFVFLTTS
jgi:hypothetical protein